MENLSNILPVMLHRLAELASLSADHFPVNLPFDEPACTQKRQSDSDTNGFFNRIRSVNHPEDNAGSHSAQNIAYLLLLANTLIRPEHFNDNVIRLPFIAQTLPTDGEFVQLFNRLYICYTIVVSLFSDTACETCRQKEISIDEKRADHGNWVFQGAGA